MRLKRTLLFFNLFLFSTAFLLGQTIEIYVSDAGDFSSDFKIVKFDANGENPETFITEQLAWPQDILFLEDQGVVLISNLNSGNITKHNAETGAFIENFATGIGGPTRMEIGADSLLYVLEWQSNGKVQRYQQDGTFVDEFNSVGVTQSIGLDWDTTGNLYVSSYGGGSVRKFDPSGNDLGIFASTNLSGPTNIWFDDDGVLIVLDWNTGFVRKFDSTGTFLGNFTEGLGNPEGIDFLPNGNLLIGNGGNGSVKEFDTDGNFIKDFIAPGSGGLQTPNAVVIREVMAVGTSDPEVVTNYIIPTIGTEFFLSSEISQDIKSIEVYNSAGAFVKKAVVKDQRIWDAQGFPDGVYFITMRAFDNAVRTQKVMVKN